MGKPDKATANVYGRSRNVYYASQPACLRRPPAPARPSPISDSDRPYLCDIQLLRQRYRATRARSVNQLLPNPESRDTQLSFVPLLGEAPSEDQAYYPVHSRPPRP